MFVMTSIVKNGNILLYNNNYIKGLVNSCSQYIRYMILKISQKRKCNIAAFCFTCYKETQSYIVNRHSIIFVYILSMHVHKFFVHIELCVCSFIVQC